MFVHTRGHSHYSLLEAIGAPKKLVERAGEIGMTSLPLTDYNGMYGAVEFYKACTAANIKPLLGVELGLVHDYTNKTQQDSAGTILLLAKNYDGYHQLLELTSRANMEGYYGKARIDRSLLEQYHNNLILCIGGETSYIGNYILARESHEKMSEIVSQFKQIFGSDMYLDIIAQSHTLLPQLATVNTTIQQLATEHDIPLLCNSNYHYIHPEDKKAYEVALSIKDGKRIYDEDRRKVVGDYHLMNGDEIQAIMIDNGRNESDIQHMFATNLTLTEKIDIDIPLNITLFPKYTSPDHINTLYEEHKQTLIEQ